MTKAWFEDPNYEYMIKTVEQGASTTIWAAIAYELENKGGLYLEDCAIAKQTTAEKSLTIYEGYMEYAVNKANALKLWDMSMDWLKNPPK